MNKNEIKNSICLDCGLCCDGTLHGLTRVRSKKKERENFISSKIKLISTVEHFFHQPCIEFCEGTGCQIYDTRPDTCRHYSCKALSNINTGKLDNDKALELIKAVKHNRDILNEYLNKKVCFVEPLNLMDKFLLLHGSDIKTKANRTEFIQSNKEAYAAYSLLEYLLDEFIRKNRKYKKFF